MKIAMLADLHGNMAALDAVDRDIGRRGVDAIYCLGDLVGKGPRSAETLDWALARCGVVLRGNWDDVVLEGGIPGAGWYRAQLGAERLRAISALPYEHRFALSGHRIRLLHGRPLIPHVYVDVDEEMHRRMFETDDGYAPDLIVFADIHRPFCRQTIGLGTLLNIGSVGNPLAGQPHASYLILEGEPSGILSHMFVQIPYDREAAVRDAEAAAGLPDGDAFIREIRTGLYSR